MTVHKGGEANHLAKEVSSNSSLRSAIILRQSTIDNLNQSLAFNILSQNFNVAIRGLFFPLFHELFSSFNNKVKQLFEAGLVQHWYLVWNPKKNKPHPWGPSVLTMDHLSMGFLVWLCCMLIAAFGFFLELAFRYRGHPRDAHVYLQTCHL